MPELPDVAVFQQYLDATALHQPVAKVLALASDLLKEDRPGRFRKRLSGNRLVATARHGKHLGVQLANDGWLLLHFGMTGWLDYAKQDTPVPDHSRLVLAFENGYRLAYVNQRKLGALRGVDDFQAFIEREQLGPDALSVDQDAFLALFDGARGTLKTRLMNQNKLAGLGNVYTDEIAFQAAIHPATPLKAIEADAAAELWRTMRHVLRTAIDRHAQPSEMPDSWLLPQRHDGRQCPRGHGALEETRVSGRTTWFCPQCQPGP
jgi:formamidopyrimidine-DNA glycosylase